MGCWGKGFYVGVPPYGIAGVHGRYVNHALLQPQMRVRLRTRQLTPSAEGAWEPAAVSVAGVVGEVAKLPFRGVEGVAGVRGRAEEGT